MAGSGRTGTTAVRPEHVADVHAAPKLRAGGTVDAELTSIVRRIFLMPGSGVRSVLFCTVPGDEIGDTAKEAAKVLAQQSGQRVALLEYTPAELTQERKRVPDLFTSFSYVIASATVSSLDDLVPLAREVDGVIVSITRNQTRVDAADTLVTTLRNARANVLGAIYFSE